MVECTGERERKGKREREIAAKEKEGWERGGQGGRQAGGRGTGGRRWRAWMEERDGWDKIEREPSVTDGDRGP